MGISKRLGASLIAMAGAFGAMSVAAPLQAEAQDAQNHTYNIPAGDLTTALQTFATQSDRNVLFAPETVAGKHSPGVQGAMPERQALEALLAGTGLRIELTASNGYAVQDPNSPTRLGDASGAASSDEGAATAEILVTGHRSLDADIRRTADDSQPYVVFSGEEIRNSGVANLEEFFRTRLPMDTQRTSTASVLGTGLTGSINLRGLGTNQTVVLVDGRRITGVSTGQDFGQPNINGISPNAIDRIEILPSTASGIYGGGATGGVVNIILKHDYTGLDISAHYGNTFNTDVSDTQLAANGGLSFEHGRTTISFSLAHTKEGDLRNSDRNFAGREFDNLARNLPPSDPSFASIFSELVGPTPNIVSTTGADLVLDDGTPLHSPWTFVPANYQGPAGDNGHALLANAGHFNNVGAADTLYESPSADTQSVTIRRELGAHVDAFIDLYHDKSESAFASTTRQVITLPAASPSNPFQQDITVSLALPDVSNVASVTSENTRFNAGLIAHNLPFGWSSSLEFANSRSRVVADTRSGFFFSTPPELEQIALSDLRAQTLPDFSGSIFSSASLDPRKSSQNEWTLRLSGPVASLPGGPISASLVFDRRAQHMDSSVSTSEFGGFPNYFWRPPSDQIVGSGYLEFVAPIVSSANRAPFIDELELTLAVRHDDYATRYTDGSVFIALPDGPFPSVDYTRSQLSSTDYTIGLRYVPSSDLVLRASYGTGFVPPALNQLLIGPGFPIPAVFLFGLNDPLRADQALIGDPNSSPPGLVQVLSRNNPNIAPEESASLSYGFVFSPHFLPGFRLSIDYTQVAKTGEIYSPSSQFVLANEASLPGRVLRGPNLPGDLPGWSGPVISIDDSPLNLSRSEVRALDFQLDYTLETERWGNWRFNAIATRTLSFTRQVAPFSPSIDTLSYSDGPLAWRGALGLEWNAGEWSIGWNTQFFDSYRACTSTDDAATCRENSLFSGPTIDRQLYHDVYLRLEIPSGARGDILSGTDFFFGIQNLFDTPPPVEFGSGYSSLGDPRMRRFSIGLVKHFGH